MGFECYRIGDLLLDAGTQEVKRDGVALRVPKLSFKLLLSLARHAPNVVTTEQLEREVWEGLVVDRGTVNKRVLLLRKVLGKPSGDDTYVAVVRGSGYRLIAQVERVECPSVGGAQDDGEGSEPVQSKSELRRRFSYGLLGILAIATVYYVTQSTIFSRVENNDSALTISQPQSAAVIYSPTSVAVLPFMDLSDGHEHQFLGDGIAEEVINLLAAMDELDVAARTSSFAFRDTNLTALEIAPRLKVGTILEGSFRHTQDRIRVTAQLIDAQSGYHIWSQNYDRSFAEVFEVQDDIARNIAQSLKLTLDGSRQIDSRSTTTQNIEAFSLYLQGRELFNDRIELRSEGLRMALNFFSEAVDRDPGFARAHAAIALTTWLLTSYDESLDKEAWFQRAEASANYALELDPDSTEALGTLASLNANRGDIEQAAAFFERIRAIGSNDSNIFHWEAMLHIRLGYFHELIAPLTEVYRLDPYNEHIGWSLAAAHNFSGNPDQAAAILKELDHFTYQQYILGLCAINAGNFAEARTLLRDVRMRSGILPAAYADMLVDALEDPGGMKAAEDTIIAAVETGESTRQVGFESLLILGSPRAFDLGIDPHSDIARIQIHAQIWNNWGVAVRQDPRFKEWVRKLGYEKFWRKYGWPDRCGPVGPNDFECV